MPSRPTLLSSCARAATAAEARYRIDAAPPTPRASRVIALDEAAAALVRELAQRSWRGTRFFVYSGATPPVANGPLADLVLTTTDGEAVRMSDELAEADFVMMIAAAGRRNGALGGALNGAPDGAAAAASAIGDGCTLRGIMTAGMVFGEESEMRAAVTALRPNARVLLISRDREDAAAILAAIGG